MICLASSLMRAPEPRAEFGFRNGGVRISSKIHRAPQIRMLVSVWVIVQLHYSGVRVRETRCAAGGVAEEKMRAALTYRT